MFSTPSIEHRHTTLGEGGYPSMLSSQRQGRRTERFAEAGVEPSIDDLVNDPVMEALLRCDRVTVSSLMGLIAATRDSLRGRSGMA